MGFDIRQTTPADLDALMALYPLAFPEEDLRVLVKELLACPSETRSWAAFEGTRLIGHALYSLGAVDGVAGAALLGPLAVLPSHQRQGVGRGLQEHAHHALQTDRVRQVFLLGDPKYYSRLGFAQENAVTTPMPIPDSWAYAWQSRVIGSQPGFEAGRLDLPAPWMKPAYWGP